MTLIIAGHVIDPEGTALVGVDIGITFDNAAAFADLAGAWDTQGRYGLSIPTDTFGAWSWPVPFSSIDPTDATCSITLPNGVRWSGILPLSHNGTLSLKDLKDTYSWGLVSAPSASVVAAQGPPGASGTSLPGVTGGPVPAAFTSDVAAPDYNPTYTFISGDVAANDSAYGRALVAFFTWTPTSSGTVVLSPPYDDGTSTEVDFLVYTGTAIGTNVPSRDGSGLQPRSIADSGFVTDGTGFNPYAARCAVVSGTAYTLAVTVYPDVDDSLPVGRTISLKPWVYSTQELGGQATLVPHSSAASGPLALREGRKTTAWGAYSHAEGYGSTSAGHSSHAEGQNTTASQLSAHAEGSGTIASGDTSHAEGTTTVASGESAHAEGATTIASGDYSHAEGHGSTASGANAHVEGDSNAASGIAAHAEGDNCVASGTSSHAGGHFSNATGRGAFAHGHQVDATLDYAHAEGHKTHATGMASHAEGHASIARLTAEHAHASGTFGTDGDAQYSRFVVWKEIAGATPTALTVDTTDGAQTLIVPANHTWTIRADVSASRSDTPGTVAGFVLSGLVTTVGGTLRLVGSPTSSQWNDADGSTWSAVLAVNGTHVDVSVTGEDGKTIRWVATVHATQVGL